MCDDEMTYFRPCVTVPVVSNSSLAIYVALFKPSWHSLILTWHCPTDDASLEAEQVGKSPALCDQDSNFSSLLDQCTDCVREATESGTASNDLIPPELSQYIDYCASLGNNTDQIDAVEVSTLLASYSSLVASQSAIEEALSSVGYNLSTNTTDMPTTTTPEPRATPTVSETAARSPDADMDKPDTNSPNTKVVVPAVVVPVVVCLIAAAAVIWALMRRRRRQQMQQDNGFPEGFDGKAQLHADEFRPELEAVTPAKEKSTDPDEHRVVAELPARELVGSEMDATNQTEERRASS